ncbi:uncharacterized protein LOC120349088 [Nilaparvata lugens]|uniref:uncharacterized protein LOC120349088 n=1 Tax=Nilaparvata lugens TaxID=108931 RepID=UPI00193E85B9|nr:uncharacterized protein LOC120349088 [Nilaparvata lugens]
MELGESKGHQKPKMPLNTQEILELITIICEKRNVQVCVTQSLRGAAITAAGALFGSLIMGPLGLVMGAVVAQ